MLPETFLIGFVNISQLTLAKRYGLPDPLASYNPCLAPRSTRSSDQLN